MRAHLLTAMFPVMKTRWATVQVKAYRKRFVYARATMQDEAGLNAKIGCLKQASCVN